MKRLAFLLMIFGLMVGAASADQKTGSLHKHTTTTGAADRVQHEPGLPRHRSSYTPPAGHSKTGAMDNQLKGLERENAKESSPATKKAATPKVAAIKSSDEKSSGKGSMNFGYQAPKSGTKNSQTSHSGGRRLH